jgi:hypothetical protein
MSKGLVIILLWAAPLAGLAQTEAPLNLTEKLQFHAERIYGPLALLGDAAYAGALQAIGTPDEWRRGAEGYGMRFASTVGWSAINNTMAFGLTATLHQDPRYFRSAEGGFWRRTGHALRGTILTRTDRGTETLSTWRLGSDYGSAFLSNQWYPDRLNTVKLGFAQGSVTMGFDLARNLATEFWPDIKRKVLRRK